MLGSIKTKTSSITTGAAATENAPTNTKTSTPSKTATSTTFKATPGRRQDPAFSKSPTKSPGGVLTDKTNGQPSKASRPAEAKEKASFLKETSADKETSPPTHKSKTTTNTVPSATKDQKKDTTTIFSRIGSVVIYLYFFTTFVCFIAFLVPYQTLPSLVVESILPQTLDSAPTMVSAPLAIFWDLSLLALFTVLHSVLARPHVKAWMALPKAWERPVFVLQSTICLQLLVTYWRNFDGPSLWDLAGNAVTSSTVLSLYVAGALFLLTATFALDHFELFGLTQGLGIDLNQKIGLSMPPSTKTGNQKNRSSSSKVGHRTLAVRWHYRLVAHPIMTGFLIMLWATPTMTLPRLLFSATMSAYIFIAVLHFEEKDLMREFGEKTYRDEYLNTVPRFVPGMKPSRC